MPLKNEAVHESRENHEQTQELSCCPYNPVDAATSEIRPIAVFRAFRAFGG
jgi:hypothetical protein